MPASRGIDYSYVFMYRKISIQLSFSSSDLLDYLLNSSLERCVQINIFNFLAEIDEVFTEKKTNQLFKFFDFLKTKLSLKQISLYTYSQERARLLYSNPNQFRMREDKIKNLIFREEAIETKNIYGESIISLPIGNNACFGILILHLSENSPKDLIKQLSRWIVLILYENFSEMQATSGDANNPRSILKLVTQAVETERRALSSEIHDDLLQSAFSAMIHCNSIYQRTREPNDKKRLELAIKSLDRLLLTGRKIIKELMPPSLESDDLYLAIKKCARSIFEQTPIKYNIQEANIQFKKLPSGLEKSIYRVTQEALMNVLKHSKATYVDIRIRVSRDKLIIVQVQDNGIGLNENPNNKEDCVGIKLMKERVRMHNGVICIDGKPNKGTSIKAVFPINSARKVKEVHCYKEQIQASVLLAVIALIFSLNYSIILFRSAIETAWARSLAPSFVNIFFQ